MPSLTDIQQQTAKISLSKNGKSTPPPMTTTNEATNVDPLGQVVQALEKKQRNLMKRKDKLESYEQAAKSGKELNTDQKEALAKYSEVLGQIECVKDLSEQVKKIQTDTAKNQKRLSKQAAEEKRVLLSHRLREYTQLRYLLDHRPSSLKAEESALLDELSGVIIPTDASLSTITRAVDTILAIYQSGPSSTVKTLTGRSSQEVRDTLEQLIKQFETTSVPSSSTSSLTEETATPQQPSLIETVNQTPLVPQPPPSTPASVLPPRESNKQHSSNTNDVLGSALTHTHLIPTQLNEHPLQFDTRDQNIPYHQLMQDSLFFLPLEPTPGNHNQQEPSNNQDNNTLQSTENNQYLQPANTLNSNLPGQSSSSPQDYSQSSTDATQRAGVATYEQNVSSNAGHMSADDQQSEEQWQHRRGNGGNAYRGGQYNGNANKNYSRGGASNYNQQQQQWRGPRGGHYENSYGGGQRHYNDSNPRAGGGGQRGGSNPNYRGNRGGGGNYRGGNRGGNAGHNGNGYARSSQQPQQ